MGRVIARELTFFPRDAASVVGGKYAAFRNPGKLAKHLRHLFDPTLAEISVWNVGTDENSPLRVSLCGGFRRPVPNGSYADAATIENLLVAKAMCSRCLSAALREALGWLYADETRRAVALAWPDSPTLSRFNGASLDMVRYDVGRALAEVEKRRS